jgi:hypothetical protein
LSEERLLLCIEKVHTLSVQNDSSIYVLHVKPCHRMTVRFVLAPTLLMVPTNRPDLQGTRATVPGRVGKLSFEIQELLTRRYKPFLIAASLDCVDRD